jgi:hypothetical protein
MAVNIAGAAARLLTVSVDGYTPGRNKPGYCLRWNYFAAGITPNLVPAAEAMDAWNYAPAEHRHPITATTVVPADVPIILGPSPTRTDAARNAGDVVLSHGGTGLDTIVSATDSLAGAGVIGTMPLSRRVAQTARPIYGYLTWWLGYELAVPGATPITPATPPSEEDTMFIAPDAQGNIWVVDLGRHTKWNAIKGCSSVAQALSRVQFWKNLGLKVVTDKQAGFVFAGLDDITNTVEV